MLYALSEMESPTTATCTLFVYHVALYHMVQDGATAIKSKVHRIEESQKRISDVRATIDKVRNLN